MVTVGKSKKGTSFIEVLVAILIFSIVITGGSILFVSGRNQINLRERYRVGVQLASQKLEQLKAGNYEDIAVGETEEGLSLEGLSFSRSTVAEDLGSYKKVTVTVDWPHMGKDHNVSLVTLIAPK